MTTGTKVVCVDDTFPGPIRKLYRALPVKDTEYTIRAVYVARSIAFPSKPGDADGEIGVLLQELHNGPDPKQKTFQELGFRADRFRPVEELIEEGCRELEELVGVPVKVHPALKEMVLR